MVWRLTVNWRVQKNETRAISSPCLNLKIEIMNKATNKAYVLIATTNPMQIGIATRGQDGYTPTQIAVTTEDYKKANKQVDQLNLKEFGLDFVESMKIVFSSM